jgi:hypothetical protein
MLGGFLGVLGGGTKLTIHMRASEHDAMKRSYCREDQCCSPTRYRTT